MASRTVTKSYPNLFCKSILNSVKSAGSPKLKISVKYVDGTAHLKTQLQKGMRQRTAHAAFLTRQAAVESLPKKRGKKAKDNPSKPGKPPHSILDKEQGGHRMITFLKYAKKDENDEKTDYLVGTEKLEDARIRPTPAVHEHGGMSSNTYRQDPGYKNFPKRSNRPRVFSPAERMRFATRVQRERGKSTPIKRWNVKNAPRKRWMSDEQKENFRVKLYGGKIVLNNSHIRRITKRQKYPKRPFMAPALKSIIPTMKGLFRNMLTGGKKTNGIRK